MKSSRFEDELMHHNEAIALSSQHQLRYARRREKVREGGRERGGEGGRERVCV